MILNYGFHENDDNANDSRIEISVDDFIEAQLVKTDAAVEEALEYVANLKEEAALIGETPRAFVYLYDPVTNTAEELEEGILYGFDK